MRETDDCYRLFRKYQGYFDRSATFAEFVQLTELAYLLPYVGGWVDSAFTTFKAGKETRQPLIKPDASKYFDIFASVVFIPTDSHDKPPGSIYVSENDIKPKFCGGTRGWSKMQPEVRSHYGTKFYGCYAIPIEPLKNFSYSFEAIRRTDGILITRNHHDYIGGYWYALLNLSENIETMLDMETQAFLMYERQAMIDAWGENNGQS